MSDVIAEDVWIVKFEDQDMEDQVFMGEGCEVAARQTYKSLSQNWSVCLLGPVSRLDAAETEVARLTARNDAFRHALITYGRKAGCFLDERVSDEFLAHIPSELWAKYEALTAALYASSRSRMSGSGAGALRTRCERLETVGTIPFMDSEGRAVWELFIHNLQDGGSGTLEHDMARAVDTVLSMRMSAALAPQNAAPVAEGEANDGK